MHGRAIVVSRRVSRRHPAGGQAGPAYGPRLGAPGTEYIVNLRTGGSFPDAVLTAPLPTLNYVSVGPQTRNLYAVDFDLAATTLWAIDSDSRELGTINLATGAFTPTVVVTGLTAGSNVTGMKFDPTSTTVYISESIGVGSNLLTLNTTTGVATPVGSIGPYLVIDIAISLSGQMYGIEIGTDNLLSIDKATGAGTPIGPVGVTLNFAQGMDFDYSTDTLWAWLYTQGGVDQLARSTSPPERPRPRRTASTRRTKGRSRSRPSSRRPRPSACARIPRSTASSRPEKRPRSSPRGPTTGTSPWA